MPVFFEGKSVHGWLSLKFEEIEQIDVNPLLIVDGEPVAVDATLIFR